MIHARAGDLVFRVYRWSPHCVSLGRNQPTAGTLGGRPAADLVPGRDVVRRPTGGRSVHHGPELTYAFAAPDRFLGGPKGIYRGVHEALAGALRALGVPLDPAAGPARGPCTRPGDSAPMPVDMRECFVEPAPGELTASGRKLVGSAQWRNRGAILQHGSILVRNDQHLATVSGEGGAGAIGLEDVCEEVPAIGALADAIVESIAALAPVVVTWGGPSADVEAAARALEDRYGSREWTWRT